MRYVILPNNQDDTVTLSPHVDFRAPGSRQVKVMATPEEKQAARDFQQRLMNDVFARSAFANVGQMNTNTPQSRAMSLLRQAGVSPFGL